MAIEKCKNKIDFLKKLNTNGYDKLTTFLTYPNFDKNHRQSKNLELKDSYIYDDKNSLIYSKKFLDDININNGIVFVGLNAASRDTQFDQNHSVFQTMHDANIGHKKNNKTNDNFIAYSVYNTKAYGSFAFDIIDNFPKNSISDTTINNLEEGIRKTNFDYPSEIKDLRHMKISDDLIDNFKNYYVPAFISIIKMLQPTKLICFGHSATQLTKAIVDSTNINGNLNKDLEVIYVPHYAAQGAKGSYEYKNDKIEEAINK